MTSAARAALVALSHNERTKPLLPAHLLLPIANEALDDASCPDASCLERIITWLKESPWELRKCKTTGAAERALAQFVRTSTVAPSTGVTKPPAPTCYAGAQRQLKLCPAARSLLLCGGAEGVSAAKAKASATLSSHGVRGQVTVQTRGVYQWIVDVSLQVEMCTSAMAIAQQAVDAASAMLQPIVVRVALPGQVHVRHLVGRSGTKIRAFEQRLGPMVATACGGAAAHLRSQVKLTAAELCVAVLVGVQGDDAAAFPDACESVRRVVTNRVKMWLEAKRQSLLGNLEQFETRAARSKDCILACRRDRTRKQPCSWIELQCTWPKERTDAKRAREARRDGRQRVVKKSERHYAQQRDRRHLHRSHTPRGSRSDGARRLVRWAELEA